MGGTRKDGGVGEGGGDGRVEGEIGRWGERRREGKGRWGRKEEGEEGVGEGGRR